MAASASVRQQKPLPSRDSFSTQGLEEERFSPTVIANLDKYQQDLLNLTQGVELYDIDEVVATYCQKAGLEFLGCGARRVAVALSKDYVAKLAWHAQGKDDNINEYSLWKGAPENIRALLAPVNTLTPERALIQARCLPLADDPLEISEQLRQYGILDRRGSFGQLGQKVVCFDYAIVASRIRESLTQTANLNTV